MSKLNNQIHIGDEVKLISKRTNRTYQVTNIFDNIKGQIWAECKNIETGEVTDQPVYDLIAAD